MLLSNSCCKIAISWLLLGFSDQFVDKKTNWEHDIWTWSSYKKLSSTYPFSRTPAVLM